MQVKTLLSLIKSAMKDYPDFEDWDIALEQHPDYKNCSNCNQPEDSIILKDNNDKCLFLKSHAIGCVYFTKDKVMGIQIHY